MLLTRSALSICQIDSKIYLGPLYPAACSVYSLSIWQRIINHLLDNFPCRMIKEILSKRKISIDSAIFVAKRLSETNLTELTEFYKTDESSPNVKQNVVMTQGRLVL